MTILSGQALSGATDVLLPRQLSGYVAVNRSLTALEADALTAYLAAKMGGRRGWRRSISPRIGAARRRSADAVRWVTRRSGPIARSHWGMLRGGALCVGLEHGWWRAGQDDAA